MENKIQDWLIELPGKLAAILDTPEKRSAFAETAAAAGEKVQKWAFDYFEFSDILRPEPPDTLTDDEQRLAAYFIIAYLNDLDSADYELHHLVSDAPSDILESLGMVNPAYPLALINRLEKALLVIKSDMDHAARLNRKDTEHRTKIITGKEFWEFHYPGGKATVDSKLIGLKFLEILLQNPHKSFTCKDLRIKAGAIGKEEGLFKGIEQIDPETAKNLRPEQIDTVLSDIKDPAEYAEKKEQIEDYLRNCKNIKGDIKNSDFKHYVSVNNALKVVYKRIESQCEPLHSHLKQWIIECCRYAPDSEIIWEFE